MPIVVFPKSPGSLASSDCGDMQTLPLPKLDKLLSLGEALQRVSRLNRSAHAWLPPDTNLPARRRTTWHNPQTHNSVGLRAYSAYGFELGVQCLGPFLLRAAGKPYRRLRDADSRVQCSGFHLPGSWGPRDETKSLVYFTGSGLKVEKGELPQFSFLWHPCMRYGGFTKPSMFLTSPGESAKLLQ